MCGHACHNVVADKTLTSRQTLNPPQPTSNQTTTTTTLKECTDTTTPQPREPHPPPSKDRDRQTGAGQNIWSRMHSALPQQPLK
jgi:hypothetical protein